MWRREAVHEGLLGGQCVLRAAAPQGKCSGDDDEVARIHGCSEVGWRGASVETLKQRPS